MKLKTDQARHALDSSALIALVRGDPGSETVRAAMGASVVCAVNLTETMAKLIRAGGEPRLRGAPEVRFRQVSDKPTDHSQPEAGACQSTRRA